jgi:hypothetical protein
MKFVLESVLDMSPSSIPRFYQSMFKKEDHCLTSSNSHDTERENLSGPRYGIGLGRSSYSEPSSPVQDLFGIVFAIKLEDILRLTATANHDDV